MNHVTWSQDALDDLARLDEFLRPKNPGAAKRALEAIRAGIKPLGRHPQLGRPRGDVGINVREKIIPFGTNVYVVRYQVRTNEVFLVGIRHGREEDLSN